MFAPNYLKAMIVGASLMQLVACGNKDKAEDVNVKAYWDDEKAVLRPNSALKVKGNIEGNQTFNVTFTIVDSNGNVVTKDKESVYVSHHNPPSDKKSLSLDSDMSTYVNAGNSDTVCNGEYTLNVIATSGSAKSSKPLRFTVQGGLDPSDAKCKTSTNLAKPHEVKRGTVYNIIGPDPGAYNLVDGVNVSSPKANPTQNDASKDLADFTADHEEKFRMAFVSRNGATFVHADNLNFETADANAVLVTYNNEQKRVHTRDLQSNNVIIVKLADSRAGAPGAFYLLKIIGTKANTKVNGRHTNDGKVDFVYRKI